MLTQSDPQAVIYVIDDDPSIREAMRRLVKSVGLRAEVFGSTSEFLRGTAPDVASCLVLDVRLPGLSGLDFQVELSRAGMQIPIIFMTGHADVPMTVKAMKGGAVEFLPKPFRDQDMLDAIRLALERDRLRRLDETAVAEIRSKFDSLTAREREIMRLVAAGFMNKQIAGELKLAEITVKLHRSSVMRKMGAKSLADLVRMSDITAADKKT